MLEIIDEDAPKMEKIMKRLYKDVIKYFGEKTSRDITQQMKRAGATEAKSFDVATDEILTYITTVSAEKVKFITNTTRVDIKNIVIDSVAEGLSILQMMEKLDKLYLEKIIPNRSQTIARTEVVSASNFGNLQGAKQTSPQLRKVWIPTFDDSTRDTHRAMANHPAIKLDEYFDVAGSRGRYPADFSLPASQSINCRCTIGYEYAKEGDNAAAETDGKSGRRRLFNVMHEQRGDD